LLECLKEGHSLSGALAIVGVTQAQVDLAGPYDAGTAALDRQAVALGLAGQSSPLLAFILRSRNRRYRDDAHLAGGLNMGDGCDHKALQGPPAADEAPPSSDIPASPLAPILRPPTAVERTQCWMPGDD
jgi:hypothetical protein